MRIALAALMGGLIMFFWGAFAHMVLPLGELSMRAPLDEARVLTALHDGLPADQGIYMLPYFEPSARKDAAAREAYSVKAKSSPFAFIAYVPTGRDQLAMGPQLFHQWLSDTLAALIVAMILVRVGAGVTRGVCLGLALGVFSWLSSSVPYWNWYRFPAAFTAGELVDQAFGWMLAGAAIGWWLARKRHARPVVT